MHPEEPTCPCCLPALGEFSEVPPHGGLPQSLDERFPEELPGWHPQGKHSAATDFTQANRDR